MLTVSSKSTSTQESETERGHTDTHKPGLQHAPHTEAPLRRYVHPGVLQPVGAWCAGRGGAFSSAQLREIRTVLRQCGRDGFLLHWAGAEGVLAHEIGLFNSIDGCAVLRFMLGVRLHTFEPYLNCACPSF